MKIPSNNVAVRIPTQAHEKINFKSGGELYIDPKFNFASHVYHTGVVECVPERLIFDKKDPNRGMRWDTDMELIVGDTVWVNRMDMAISLGDKCPDNAEKKHMYPNKYIENEDGSLTVFVRYDSCWFVNRNEELFPINGWLILEPMEEEVYEGSLLIPDSYKKGHSVTIGRVAYAGKRIKEYGHEIYQDSFNVEVGDIVYLPKLSDIVLENDLHKTLGEDKKFFIVQRHRLVSTYNDMKGLMEQVGIEVKNPTDIKFKQK